MHQSGWAEMLRLVLAWSQWAVACAVSETESAFEDRLCAVWQFQPEEGKAVSADFGYAVNVLLTESCCTLVIISLAQLFT
jgi:hypothetical protein